MKLFGQIVGALVETAKLPVDVVVDGVMLMADAGDGKVAPRTRRRLNDIKDAAREDAPKGGHE